MAVDTHYIERDSSGAGAGFWAVIVILALVILMLLFGTSLFSRNNNTGTDNTGGSTNIQGEINTPSGNGSGSVNTGN